jgi:hypothetical protein
MDKMKNKSMHSNAPPQCRGVTSKTGNRQLTVTHLNLTGQGKLKTKDCNVYRIAKVAPAVSAKVPVYGLLFRSTGRDGPPGSFQTIPCGPVWLVEKGKAEAGRNKSDANHRMQDSSEICPTGHSGRHPG